tara:strand:- start:283 stop:1101 length:819 start_codon:yes stop_codon:yes gene_type:complete
MKKLLPIYLILSVLFFSCVQEQEQEDAGFKIEDNTAYIEWTGDNAVANELVFHGMRHYNNIEWGRAYAFFEKSLEYDSTLFASHNMLAFLSKQGWKRDGHVEKAKRFVEGKNESSNLFVSIHDIPRDSNFQISRHKVWEKMHEVTPEGSFIHFWYAFTKPTVDEKIAEMEVVLEKFKNAESPYEHVLNALGYMYYNKGDKEKSKSLFEEYVDMYPSANSYDSMAEYYLKEDSLQLAVKYYTMATEYYPFFLNANNKLREIREMRVKSRDSEK